MRKAMCVICGKTPNSAVFVQNPDGTCNGILADVCPECSLKQDRHEILTDKIFHVEKSAPDKTLEQRRMYIESRQKWIQEHPFEELPANSDSYYGIK